MYGFELLVVDCYEATSGAAMTRQGQEVWRKL